ncbi:MAG: electron transport complex subunit E [Oscillospiraceae bacterium]|jgi:electron transport complex protein RnfE|nr:electron transport complex subunit E [Oscillospiraceae bacterium]
MEKKGRLSLLFNGVIKENPVLVLLLGTCPTLAVSTMAVNGLGMGAAATFVLICSNVVIAMLKNVIPDKVRIPCYIVIIAGFVTMVQLIVKAYAPEVDQALGLFLPLIVVNCIILGRAEMFASKNSVLNSALDGLGMGLGFTLALLIMGSVREILGSGTWFGIPITAGRIDPMSIFLLAPGGFFVYGTIIAALNKLTKGRAIKRKSMGCDGCPSAAACGGAGTGQCPPDKEGQS